MTTSFSKSRMKIVLLEGVHDRAVENFKRHGYTAIERHKKALAGAELRDAVADAHFVGIRQEEHRLFLSYLIWYLFAALVGWSPKLENGFP